MPHTAQQSAVLIEAGIIVNRESEQMLAAQETRRTILQAIVDGFSTCLTGGTEAQ